MADSNGRGRRRRPNTGEQAGTKSGGIIGYLASLCLLAAMAGCTAMVIYRAIDDTTHKAAFDDDLPWPEISERRWMTYCRGAYSSQDNLSGCRASAEMLWLVRVEEIPGTDEITVSLTAGQDRETLPVELASPVAWPQDRDRIIGRYLYLSGEVETDAVFGHEIEDAIVWGMPYGPAEVHADTRPVDFVLYEYVRRCADLDRDAFAQRCQGKRILLDATIEERKDSAIRATLPLKADPPYRVLITADGRYPLSHGGQDTPGQSIRIVGTIAGSRSGTGADAFLVLDPASILQFNDR